MDSLHAHKDLAVRRMPGTPKSSSDGKAPLNATAVDTTPGNSSTCSEHGSNSSVASTTNHICEDSFPSLKGVNRTQLRYLYVANEDALTKHISAAAGATEVFWCSPKWSLRWYDAEATPSTSSLSQGTAHGRESHSIVKHAAIPYVHIEEAVDKVLERVATRRLGWVVGPALETDSQQAMLEVTLIRRGLWLEDEQPVMVIDLDKASVAPLGGFCSWAPSMRLGDSPIYGTRVGNSIGYVSPTSAKPPLGEKQQRENKPNMDLADYQAQLRLIEQQQRKTNPRLADYQMQLMLLEQKSNKRGIMQQAADQKSWMSSLENQTKTDIQSRIERLRLDIEGDQNRLDRLRSRLKEERAATTDKQTRGQGQPESYHTKDSYYWKKMLIDQDNKRWALMAKRKQLDEMARHLEPPQKTERQQREGDAPNHPSPPSVSPGKIEHHYETLDLLTEEDIADQKGDNEQSEKQQLSEPVQTSVGDFLPIEKSDGEGDSAIAEHKSVAAEHESAATEHKSKQPSPLQLPITAIERKPEILSRGIMIGLLISPDEAEAWVRVWAHEARGAAGEADIAHWTSVYRALLSRLPSSQFAMYVARDLKHDGVIGTGFLHIHSGVSAIHGINVLPGYRNAEIGSWLTKYGMKISRQKGVKIATLTSTQVSRGLFSHIGFREFGRVKLYSWRPKEIAAAKEKELKGDAEEEGWDWVDGSP